MNSLLLQNSNCLYLESTHWEYFCTANGPWKPFY